MLGECGQGPLRPANRAQSGNSGTSGPPFPRGWLRKTSRVCRTFVLLGLEALQDWVRAARRRSLGLWKALSAHNVMVLTEG